MTVPRELASQLVLFAKCNYTDQVKEDEMGRACSTKGEKRNAYRLLGKSQAEREH
jgi:hypothetical protein